MESFKHATSRENGTTSPQATQRPASMINFWPISFPPRLLPPEDFEETPRGRDVACFPLKYFQLLFFFITFSIRLLHLSRVRFHLFLTDFRRERGRGGLDLKPGPQVRDGDLPVLRAEPAVLETSGTRGAATLPSPATETRMSTTSSPRPFRPQRAALPAQHAPCLETHTAELCRQLRVARP